MEKFRTIVGEKKEEVRREVAEIVAQQQQPPQTPRVETPREAEPSTREATKEVADVGQFMRYVASTIARLPPEERTFVRFLIAPKATPLAMNDRMIDVIFKNIDLLEEMHIEALSKAMSPEDLVKLAEKFNPKLASLIAILAEKCRPQAPP